MRSMRFTQLSVPRRAALAAVLAASLAVATGGGAVASVGAATPSPGPTGPLTTDQLKKALPTDADITGYTFDPTQDTSTLTSVADTLTTGGAPCQKFLNATEGLTTTYGTVAEVDRTLRETTGGRTIHVSIMSFNSPAAATTVLTDAKDGLNGCTSVAGTLSGSATTGTFSPIPQLASATDRIGYVAYLTTGGLAVLLAAETVQVGSTIVNIDLIGPQTQDTTTLQAMGTALGSVTDVVTGKVSSAAV
jgi:hypothetical protein